MLDQGLREADKRHKQYRGLHVNVPKDEWPNALRILSQSNGELEEGKVVAGVIEQFDPKSRTISVDLGAAKASIPQPGWQWADVSNKRAEKIFRSGDVENETGQVSGTKYLDCLR